MWRTGMPDRPALDVTARWHGRRPLKRWRWVGCFAEDVLACAAVAHVGPLTVSWWAAWDRGRRTLMERSVKRAGLVDHHAGGVRVADGPFALNLALEDAGTGVETISDHRGAPIWTRKQPVRCTGTLTMGDRTFALDAPGLVDDSAGYHARRTSWFWSAGAGTATDGRRVAWNLVAGLHDAASGSERTLWVDGEPRELPPAAFAPDLTAVGGLHFTAEAARSHREERLLVASDYEQPFGAFRGTLPAVGAVAGLGVMERHAARW